MKMHGGGPRVKVLGKGNVEIGCNSDRAATENSSKARTVSFNRAEEWEGSRDEKKHSWI